MNTVFSVTNNTFKSATSSLNGVLQITEGKRFTVSGNRFESGVKGYAIKMHELLNNAEVEISGNVFDSAKYILFEGETETANSFTYENNSGTAIPAP